MAHQEAWQQIRLTRLTRHREGSRDPGLALYHCGDRGKYDKSGQGPKRNHQKERIRHRRGCPQDQCARAKITQRKRRKDKQDPGQLHRLEAKMSEIGIQRLGPGD